MSTFQSERRAQVEMWKRLARNIEAPPSASTDQPRVSQSAESTVPKRVDNDAGRPSDYGESALTSEASASPQGDVPPRSSDERAGRIPVVHPTSGERDPRRDKPGETGTICEHRDYGDWQDEADLFPQGDVCGAPAEWLSCTPIRDQPVCAKHKCRCNAPLKKQPACAVSSCKKARWPEELYCEEHRGPFDPRTAEASPRKVNAPGWVGQPMYEAGREQGRRDTLDGLSLIGLEQRPSDALQEDVSLRPPTEQQETDGVLLRRALGVIATFSTDEWSREAAKMGIAGETITRDKPGRRVDNPQIESFKPLVQAARELVTALGFLPYATHCLPDEAERCERVIAAEDNLSALLDVIPRTETAPTEKKGTDP